MLTRRGWFAGVLAAALLVAGRVFGMIEGYIIGSAIGLLLVVSVLWLVVTRIDVQVSRTLHPPRVHAGGSSRVDLTVTNRARHRTPVLAVRDHVSGTRGASLLVPPLPPHASARAAYRFATERRGVVTVGPLLVELTDPFGLARLSVPAAGRSELVVYPRIEPLVALPLSAGNDPMAGAEHPNWWGRGGEDFYALRAYVVGDDLRRVHWPSTARHDDLMVRQDEMPWQGRTTVVLDDRRSVHSAESFERAVSAAASVVTAGSNRRDLVRVITASGMDSGFNAGRGHVESLLEALACISPGDEADLAGPAGLLAPTGVGGGLVVLTGDAASEAEALVNHVRPTGALAVLAFSDVDGDPTGRAGPVATAGPTTPLAVGWSAAVARGAIGVAPFARRARR